MTVRITEIPGVVRCLRVEGRLASDAVDELEQLVGADPRAVCLELDELRSVDAAGLELLCSLRDRGFALRGVPPYLALRIRERPDPVRM